MKTCKKCNVEKPLSEFHKDKKLKDGHSNRCKECAIARAKEHYQSNREDAIARQKAWTEANRDKTREYSRRFYERNAERVREQNRAYSSAYSKANPEKMRMKSAKRRALLLSAGHENIVTWLELLQFYGGVCLKCGATEDLQADHVVPLAEGGRHATYNLQILCRSCNSSKSNRNAEDYRKYPKLIAILE